MITGLLGVLLIAMAIGILFYEDINLKASIPIAIVLLILSYASFSVVIIEAGDRGVIFNVFKGVNTTKVLNEGMHVIPKIINKVTVYDVYTKTWEENISCLSSDGLPMEMHVSIRYRFNADKVCFIKQNVGNEKDVNNKILIPTSRSKMRDIAAKFTAQDAFAHKRAELQEAYRDLLTKFFEEENYLTAEQILVRKVLPPADLTKKIQETKVAEQEVIKQKNVLEAEKMKKEQKIIQAQADSEALRIKGQAIAKSPQIISKEWIDKWDGKLPVTMLGDGKNIIIDLSSVKQ